MKARNTKDPFTHEAIELFTPEQKKLYWKRFVEKKPWADVCKELKKSRSTIDDMTRRMRLNFLQNYYDQHRP